MLRNNPKAQQPKIIRPNPVQQPTQPPAKVPQQQSPSNNLGLSDEQYTKFSTIKKFLGSRVDDGSIIKKIRQRLCIEEIVNGLSAMSMSQRDNSLTFNKLSCGVSKQKVITQFPGPILGTLKQQSCQKFILNHNLRELYNFDKHSGNFAPDLYI